jgi:hypothetical protein
MSRNDRKRTDGLGADPDTAIYLEPLGGPLGRLFLLEKARCRRSPSPLGEPKHPPEEVISGRTGSLQKRTPRASVLRIPSAGRFRGLAGGTVGVPIEVAAG